MSPNSRQPDIARTQLFFIDSSRTRLSGVSSFELQNTTPVFDAAPLGLDDRKAAVFFGSQPGTPAYAAKGKQSFFSEALLRCLDGDAAVPLESNDDESLTWGVTINSLVGGLGPALEALTHKYDMGDVRPRFEVGGLVQDAVIVRRDGPPDVRVQVTVFPPEAVPYTKIDIEDDQGKLVAQIAVGETPKSLTLPAGYYRCRATSSETFGIKEFVRLMLIKPPQANLNVMIMQSGAND
jgi:hypothetical protein